MLDIRKARYAAQAVATSIAITSLGCTPTAYSDARPASDPVTYYAAPLSSACSPEVEGSGTIDDPWSNPYIALMNGSLQPGDTLQLRGGVYRNEYAGFMRDRTDAEGFAACDDDLDRSDRYDGKHTVLPILLAGARNADIIIENFPGEDVIIDGSNARFSGHQWSQCGEGVYRTSDFNFGSARTPQIWIDPSTVDDVGTRLRWNSNESDDCKLEPGEFSYSESRVLYVHLPDGSDPSTHSIHATCQGGDCAAHPIHAGSGASFVTVRRNPGGGRFIVKYGYYNGYITGGAHDLTFDGIEWVAAGGRDYGFCFRIHDGHRIDVRNGSCRESMAQGIGYYGGLPDVGINISANSVSGVDIADTGRAWVDGGGIGNNLGMGIILKNCSGCKASGNTIRNSYRGGIQVNHSTTRCSGEKCRSNDNVIDGNDISGFCNYRLDGDASAGQTDCAAIYVRHAPTNGEIVGILIQNNVIHGTSNASFSNDAAPAAIYTDGDIPGAVIRNNSMFGIPGACVNVEPNSEPVTVHGNAMENCSTSGSGCNGEACSVFAGQWSRHDFSYNTYWAADGDDQVVRRSWGFDVARDDVGESWEPSAVQASPGFVSGSDLRLQDGSELVDAQPCEYAPPHDRLGRPRPAGSRCDIGAYEMQR